MKLSATRAAELRGVPNAFTPFMNITHPATLTAKQTKYESFFET
ncbi:hypothetical protein DES52_11621 [Deinococcus yavapaiensis KR-236]|uniref:Uncharacterized protein n=1 Tax=Deinococcus yavapaiensis KR-236 TaxID=694435 RepID=A0A318S2A0_9DEIO|nr:hypothetical protein DES52_11621 [Deinococcus yavapaiensis KR-236]